MNDVDIIRSKLEHDININISKQKKTQKKHTRDIQQYYSNVLTNAPNPRRPIVAEQNKKKSIN